MNAAISKPKADLQGKLQEVPHKPGVYVMRDRLDRVIYVGKARDLRKRLAYYFTPSRQTTSDLKTRALIQSIWDFEWHTVKSDPEAILYEGRLIKEYRPKYNISFRDDKRFLMLKANTDEPYPRFRLTRVRKDDGAKYFGPFPHSGALRTTLHWIKKEYGLRSCRPKVPGESDYKHCLDHIIRNCSAPCIGKITSEEYKERFMEACALLEGKSGAAIDKLEEAMKAAAGKMDFERAAELRDMLKALRETTRPMRKFTRKSLPGSIDPASDLRVLQDALQLQHLPAHMECFDISNISTTHNVASMVCFRNGVPDRNSYRRYRIRSVKGQDDFASMAEVVRRRYSRALGELAQAENLEDSQLPLDEVIQRTRMEGESRIPDLIIVDGGKGQLSSACRELRQLGLFEQPVIGLAKEFEEIYRPGVAQPILLPQDSGALKLLQRIRDEAHRFANGYHQLLMKRRISESILDDCPGISENRKTRILKKFGSLKRLRSATVGEIAQIEGMSARLAGELVKFLEDHR